MLIEVALSLNEASSMNNENEKDLLGEPDLKLGSEVEDPLWLEQPPLFWL